MPAPAPSSRRTVALLSLYVNRVLLPKEVRPGWFHQIGVVACGMFFLGVSGTLLYMFFLA